MIDPSPWAYRPHPGRYTVAVPLTAEQRATCEALLRTPTVEQRIARRAQALLLLADGLAAPDIARLLGVDERTVEKWRKRFRIEDPTSRLQDARRSGRPRARAPRPTTPA